MTSRNLKPESRWMRFLLGAERIIITLAACAAIVPLVQFYLEAQDRRIDRAANFILAHRACDSYFLDIAKDAKARGVRPSYSGGIGEECVFILQVDRKPRDYSKEDLRPPLKEKPPHFPELD